MVMIVMLSLLNDGEFLSIALHTRRSNMPSDGKKEPPKNLMDTLRSYFVSEDPQDKKNSLPPKAHFSIWYGERRTFEPIPF